MFGSLLDLPPPLRRLLWWGFLITLPFHFAPFLNGLIEGVIYSNFLTETYFASLDHFSFNVQTAQWADPWSDPSSVIGHEPFYVVQLHDPQRWWEKLGLKRFDIDITDDVAMANIPIDSFASLEALYRRAPKQEQAQPWHHFIYASPSVIHIEDIWLDKWDRAFNELLQYHYANPTPTGAGFHYLSCWRSFLCDIWATRGPALLHFTTESPDPSNKLDELNQRQQIPGHLPVVVRIIEFPLTEPDKLGLPPSQFPSHFNQLRSVTSQPQMWQLYKPFNKMAQVMKRLADRCSKAEKRYAQTYGRLYKLEIWIQNMLGLESSPWPGLARIPAIALSSGVSQVLGRAWEFVEPQARALHKRYWDKKKNQEPLERLDERTKWKRDDDEETRGKRDGDEETRWKRAG